METLMNLEQLLHHEIKDLYSAENQLVDALPKMAAKAFNPDLKDTLKEHLEETIEQRNRLMEIADKLNITPDGQICKGMKGIIAEGEDLSNQETEHDVLDAAIILAAQRVEHYEIAGYGTARDHAKRLEHQDVYELLSKSLDEEKNADKTLNKLATGWINDKAKITEQPPRFSGRY